MRKPRNHRVDLLSGTLDLLILRTLVHGSSHGHAIARHIRRVSEDALRVETGSLCRACTGRWDAAGSRQRWKKSDKGKRAGYYQLIPSGRRQLAVERSRWEQLSVAMARVLRPPD